jgi:TonB family protein
MRRTLPFIILTIAALITLAPTRGMAAQGGTAPGGGRKVVARVAPVYPELAKRMTVQGIVKVEVVVKPNGTVKSTRLLGGNPVLVDAATTAVTKWKFEPSANETTEVVQIVFSAQ